MEVECARALMHARDILRTVGITGFDATANIATLLTLRELETQYPNLTDPGAFVLERAHAALKPTHNKGIVCFSALVEQVSQQAEKNTSVGFAETVRDVIRLLQCHKKAREATYDVLKVLYESVECAFTVRDDKAACALVRHVHEKLTMTADSDVLGAAYMQVVRGHAQEKELGQFFTPKALVSYLVKRASTCAETNARATGLDRSTVRALGHVLDPTCGSASFLVSAARAGATSVTGIEIDPRVSIVANFAVMSAGTRASASSLSAGPRASASSSSSRRSSPSVSRAHIHRADFLRESPGQLEAVKGGFGYDTVLANPPFGVKTKYADIVTGDADTKLSFPISSSATGMFLQRIVRVLCIGGMGLVILPLGNELASRQKKQTELRVALLRAVELLEIVSVPPGTFANTGIRTAALVFVKRRELQPTSGTPNDFATRKVRLVSLDDTGVRAEDFVEMAAIAAKSYSLSPDDYTTRPAEPETRAAFPIVRLGDLFAIKKGTIQASKVIAGDYPVISIGLGKTHNQATDEGEVLVTTLASAGTSSGPLLARIHYHNGPCAITDIVGRLIPFDAAQVDLRYSAYVLRSMLPTIGRVCEKGLANKSLDKARFMSLEIPLPPLDVQAKIAAELDALERNVADIERGLLEASNLTLRAIRLALDAQLATAFPSATNARLGDVCTLQNPQSIRKSELRDGPYPVVGGGVSPMGYHSEHNTEAMAVLISGCGATAGHVSRYNTPVFRTSHCYRIVPCSSLTSTFMFHLLKAMQDQICALRHGTAQPYLHKEQFYDLEIRLPPLEVQAKIAAELDVLEREVDEAKRGLLKASELARRAIPQTLTARLGAVSGMPAGSDSDWSDMDTASI